jgi:predicted deacylase
MAKNTQTFSIGSVKCVPGALQCGHLKLGERGDGSEVLMPLVVINGVDPGPVVWIEGGTHGDELEGFEVMRVVRKEANPAALKGTIIAAPAANILGCERYDRRNPLDCMDLNRVFPGKPRGFFTEQIANLLYNTIVGNANYVIDLHAGGLDLWMHTFTAIQQGISELDEKALQVARAFGAPVIWKTAGTFLGASLGAQVTRAGIPVVLAEAGGGVRPDPTSVDFLARGTLGILRYLRMIPGDPPQDREKIVANGGDWVRTTRGGLFYPAVKNGDLVRKGEVVGRLHNYFDDIVETLESPTDGIVLGIKHRIACPTGDWTVLIGVTG